MLKQKLPKCSLEYFIEIRMAETLFPNVRKNWKKYQIVRYLLMIESKSFLKMSSDTTFKLIILINFWFKFSEKNPLRLHRYSRYHERNEFIRWKWVSEVHIGVILLICLYSYRQHTMACGSGLESRSSGFCRAWVHYIFYPIRFHQILFIKSIHYFASLW